MSAYSENSLNKDNENEAWSKVYNFIKPNSRILDIGCSSGRLGEALIKDKNAYVVGLDLDDDDIELAKKNLNEAHKLNIEKDKVSHLGKFDMIIMADVIEHLVDPVKALKKIRSLLNPKGELIFSIPNMANATVRIELLKGHFEYREWGLLDRTHLHFYDQDEVNRVFNDAGYNVIQTDCTIRGIPHKILKKELAPLGIEITPKLVNVLNKPDALTYQFVGRAAPSAKPNRFVAQSTSSLDSITREIDSVVQQLAAKEQQLAAKEQLVEAKENQVKLLDKERAQIDAKARLLDKQLNAILSSRGWKLLEKIYRVKSRFNKHH
ncbi:MAG: hypothetical protein NVS1B7_1530 [Candidatus Saccharimonadales bacterium]